MINTKRTRSTIYSLCTMSANSLFRAFTTGVVKEEGAPATSKIAQRKNVYRIANILNNKNWK